MPNGVYDDLSAADLVEDEERVWSCGQSPDIRIVGPETNLGMDQQQTDQVPNALLDACCSPRGSC